MKNKLLLTYIIITIGLLLITPIQSTQAQNTASLVITNLSGVNTNFSEEQLLAMTKIYSSAELYCYGDLVTSGNWGGVSVNNLLLQANATSEVASIELYATDGYKVTIPLELAIQPDVIIAYEKDGQALSEGLRLILPGYNGAVWIAMISSIRMSASGSNYPEVTATGSGSISNQLQTKNNPTPSVSKTPTPVQPAPTTIPTPEPENPQPIQTENPIQATQQPQPTPQAVNSEANQQTLLFTAIVLISVLSITAVASVTYRRRKPSL